MNDLFLVFVNLVGNDVNGDQIYEFIFSSQTIGIEGQDWDQMPASIGEITPPDKSMIEKIRHLRTNRIQLDLAQKCTSFSMWDAIDGVIPLAWENSVDYVSKYGNYPENRLIFRFGETEKDIITKLAERDANLEK